jgi:hypothetical protein
MEDLALGRRWLPTPFRHERLGGQGIQFREPLFYVREYRLDKDSSPGAAYSYPVSFEPELSRKADGLTAPVLEQLCGGGHEPPCSEP